MAWRLVLVAGTIFLCSCGGATSPSLDAPTLVSPADFALLDNGCLNQNDLMTWSFTWSAVPGATSYHLYVKQDAATFPVIDQKGITVAAYTLNTTSYTAALTGWHWYVQAEANGTEGPQSRMGAFDVEPVDTDCK